MIYCVQSIMTTLQNPMVLLSTQPTKSCVDWGDHTTRSKKPVTTPKIILQWFHEVTEDNPTGLFGTAPAL